MFRNRISKVFAVVSLIFFWAGHAAAAPELRVAYVDMQQALQDSKAGQKVQKQFEVEVQEEQKSIDKKKSEYERLKAAFDKQKDSLNAKALQDKQEELAGLERDIKRAFGDSQEKLRRKNATLVQELVKQIRAVVDKVGKEDSFTIILEKSAQSVLYADSSIDITPKVVKRFDEVGQK